MFAIVTEEKQKKFEQYCIDNGIGSDEKECHVPCICGYYARACRSMNETANSMLCTRCSFAEFSK